MSSRSQDSEPPLSDSKIPTAFALTHNHIAGKLLNLDQVLSGIYRIHLYRGQETGLDELWNRQSEEDQSSLQLLEDFRSFKSGNRIPIGELSHHP